MLRHRLLLASLHAALRAEQNEVGSENPKSYHGTAFAFSKTVSTLNQPGKSAG
jgi:hypothetical protein